MTVKTDVETREATTQEPQRKNDASTNMRRKPRRTDSGQGTAHVEDMCCFIKSRLKSTSSDDLRAEWSQLQGHCRAR